MHNTRDKYRTKSLTIYKVNSPTSIQCKFCKFKIIAKKITEQHLNLMKKHTEFKHKKEFPKKQFKCRSCSISFENSEELTKHYRKNHKRQQNRFRYVSKVDTKLIAPPKPQQTEFSLQEKEIDTFLSQNNAYFEKYPSFFIKELNKEVFPTFIIYSWDNKKLITPLYLWVETKEDDEGNRDFYYIKKHLDQGRKHFIIRYAEKKEQLIKSLINKFVNLQSKGEEDSKYTAISLGPYVLANS